MKDAVPDEGILRKLNSYFSDLYFIFYQFSNFMNAQYKTRGKQLALLAWSLTWIGTRAGQVDRREAMAVRGQGGAGRGKERRDPHQSASDGGARTARQQLSVEAFAGLGKMAALIRRLDGGDDAEAGTSGSEAWRAEGADMELGSGMEVADPEWPVAEL
jgi:hypothetical protein